MARGDTHRAIGAVTSLLQDHLNRRAFNVTVGKPEDAADNDSTAKLNLFLYETSFDASMRNVSYEEGRPPPVWMVLRYLLTAFDDGELSDSAAAHELLGRGIMALNDLNYLRLDAAVALSVRQALEWNTEPLKITFEDSAPDLLSKLMQGSDESYRVSAALQVRPILMLPEEPDPSSLLVGVDYTQSPPVEVGLEGVQVSALPSLGPVLERIEPTAFEPGESGTVYGTDLHLSGLEAVLGGQVLRITSQQPDRLTVEFEGTPTDGGPQGPVAAGASLSAGEHGLSVQQALPSGRRRASNLLAAALRPVVSGAVMAGANLQLTGLLLGGADDDVVLTLLSDGVPVQSFEAVTTAADQQSLTVTNVAAAGSGTYLALLRVNGQQARISPLVVIP